MEILELKLSNKNILIHSRQSHFIFIQLFFLHMKLSNKNYIPRCVFRKSFLHQIKYSVCTNLYTHQKLPLPSQFIFILFFYIVETR